MEQSKKKQLLHYVTIVIIIVLIYILFSVIRYFIKKHEYESHLIKPVSTIEDTIPADDISLTSASTIAEGEVSIQDAPCRLVIENKNILCDTTLPTLGYRTLDDYMNQYFNYYWNNGTNYLAEIVEGSYDEDYNFPSFKVYVPELDLEIDCYWYVAREVYHFYSRFNPEG